MSRGQSWLPLLLLPAVLTGFVVAGCESDDPIQEKNCGNVVMRCHWNPQTQRYDRDCTYSPPDAGTGTCDAGAPDSPAD